MHSWFLGNSGDGALVICTMKGAEKIERIGFACVLSDGSLTTNHGFILRFLGETRIAEAIQQNLDDLERILFQLSSGPLRQFRLGSSLIPFASHPAFNPEWYRFAAGRLERIGRYWTDRGFRFSMHPGQYTILNSPNPVVVSAAIAEIDYAATVLDFMGLDESHRIVVHGGGIYGDRVGSTERLISQLHELPEKLRRRLVLENDERQFNLEQILEVAEAAKLPVVFDLHHFQINPSPDLAGLLERVRDTWPCRPKVHLSSQRPNARIGTHDDLIHREDLEEMCRVLPFSADLMIEAKAKEIAALQVADWLRRTREQGSPRNASATPLSMQTTYRS